MVLSSGFDALLNVCARLQWQALHAGAHRTKVDDIPAGLCHANKRFGSPARASNRDPGRAQRKFLTWYPKCVILLVRLAKSASARKGSEKK